MKLTASLVLSVFSAFAASAATTTSANATALDAASKAPVAPALTFLYTSFVNIGPPIDVGVGPKGDRIVIPITGGNFTGPRLSGLSILTFSHYRNLTLNPRNHSEPGCRLGSKRYQDRPLCSRHSLSLSDQ
jgi:hypothetical protein